MTRKMLSTIILSILSVKKSSVATKKNFLNTKFAANVEFKYFIT